VSFAIPWEGVLMLGTTDDMFDDDPAAVSVTAEDEREILAEAARALPEDVIRPEHVLARFAGLRVLPTARRGTAAARRATVVSRGPNGMVSVAGGKLTTFRHIAAGVLEAVGAGRPRRAIRPPVPLPGAGDVSQIAADLQGRWPDVGDETAELLARTYGTHAPDVLDHADGSPDALAPLVAGEPEIVAQIAYARDYEWAVTVDDVLRRRTTLALRGLDTPELRSRVEAALGAADAAIERR
jgi:glycerol-3-phosphate dehydrogenase